MFLFVVCNVDICSCIAIDDNKKTFQWNQLYNLLIKRIGSGFNKKKPRQLSLVIRDKEKNPDFGTEETLQ